ncbi:reverse transcriptase family protein [Methyloradius palustris]|uniref:Reverse transcriptase domain-containing protein n=1 Tax=Methyloradius palustris TaxID=2778876 RepID=A0A8D5G0Q4_9PROT|nr:reverse transcriptase family protein [Methyloradius palustris]BCM25712.1 hypothetical protein ZMTM_19710 [Methyloradius palustris]
MHKQYSIDQSPLYRIVGLNQLEKRLNIKLNRLDRLLKDGSYRTFLNKKNRPIQHPVGLLNVVHGKIAYYLARIRVPDYVYSQKFRSYVDNAYEHKGIHPVAKTDISKYFPSISKQMVKQMFVEQFKCAKDIAEILANICCFQQKHLPTGSVISGYVAFFACKKLFDQIHSHANSAGCSFTLYVDDLTISGSQANRAFLYEIRKMILSYGLSMSVEKTITYSAYAPKKLTGVIVKYNQCLLPNEQHKTIRDKKIAIQNAVSEADKVILKKSLKGSLQQAKQIEKVNAGLIDYQPTLIYS